MSDFYKAWIDDAESDALTLLDLKQMFDSGFINPDTPIRLVSNSEWSSWSQISIINKDKPALRSLISTSNQKTPESMRQEIRGHTAYPALRTWIYIFFGIDIISCVAFAILIFADGQRAAFYLPSAIACMVGIIPLAVCNAFLDIADCSIRQEAYKV